MARSTILLLFFLSTAVLSSCSVVEGIFKAGVWVGVLAVVAVIVLIIWLIAKIGGNKNSG